MAEFKMPKWVYKDKTITLDECYQQLADMSYTSPVNIISQGVRVKMENDIFEAIQSYGIDVDKDELIKALQYDRDQYRKGFADRCRGMTDKIKAELAREIIADLREQINGYENIDVYLDRIEKKYTEEQE